MKTLTTLIAGAALATASTLVNAEDVKPTPISSPFAPFAAFADQQVAIAEHQKMIAQQQRAFAEQHANAVRNTMAAQRRFAEQMATPFPVPGTARTPEMFELYDMPAAPDLAGLDPQSRRTAMRKYLEERREAMRKQLQQQRDAAFQARDRYLDKMGLVRPEV